MKATVNTADIASALNVSVRTVQNWAKEGRLPEPQRVVVDGCDRPQMRWAIDDLPATLVTKDKVIEVREPVRKKIADQLLSSPGAIMPLPAPALPGSDVAAGVFTPPALVLRDEDKTTAQRAGEHARKQVLAALTRLRDAAGCSQAAAMITLLTNARNLIHECKSIGIDLLITSTYRDLEAQAALYAQGRTAPGKIVTNARAGQSFHNFRVAFDVVPLRAGKPVWGTTGNGIDNDPTDDDRDDLELWQRIGAIGELYRLEWAGRWTRFREFPHFQFTGGLTLADFGAGKTLREQAA